MSGFAWPPRKAWMCSWSSTTRMRNRLIWGDKDPDFAGKVKLIYVNAP